jgi:hypothetical protein
MLVNIYKYVEKEGKLRTTEHVGPKILHKTYGGRPRTN